MQWTHGENVLSKPVVIGMMGVDPINRHGDT